MGIRMMELGREKNGKSGEISLRGGREHTEKEHHYGPYMHDFYDLQYCKEGSFVIYLNDVPYEIEKGMLFCVPPYVKVEKQFPDLETASVFICAKGQELKPYFASLGFSLKTPVFAYELPAACIEQMEALLDTMEVSSSISITRRDAAYAPQFMSNSDFRGSTAGYLQCTGLFYLLLSHLMQIQGNASEDGTGKTARREYVEKAISYMETNYPYDINVDTVSRHVGLNRSYLYSLFREEVGLSIQEFLIQTRMRAACDFLRHQDVQIKTVAASVGYEPVAFAHIFKKTLGMSAQEYRAKYQKGD